MVHRLTVSPYQRRGHSRFDGYYVELGFMP
jgi:hypothetical protein